MAKKSAKAQDTQDQTTVTRIKAKDDTKSTAKQATVSKQPKLVTNADLAQPKQNFIKKFFGYFKGAWFELRQVRWPNRRATAILTVALLIFTALFAGFILIVDLAFENLFKLILGQ